MRVRVQDLVSRTLRRPMREERGASLVEYALLVALIAVVAIGAVTYLGENGSGKIDEAAATLGDGEPDAPDAGCPASHPTAFNDQYCVDVTQEEWEEANQSGNWTSVPRGPH